MTENIYDCIVIGAGFCGLTAAERAQSSGHSVVLLDKARGPGGRMCTRRVEVESGRWAKFDHGAQYFTARSEEFKRSVARWESEHLLHVWFQQSPGQDSPTTQKHPRYVPRGGMSALPKHLAKQFDVRLETPVLKLSNQERLVRIETAKEIFLARSVLLTPPAPQSLELLKQSSLSCNQEAEEKLASIHYEKCIALLLRLRSPSSIPAPGAVFAGSEPISWIADNTQKKTSPDIDTVTVHCGPEFSEAYFAATQEQIVERLRAELEPYLKLAAADIQIQRWRYSKPKAPLSCYYLELSSSPRVLVAGEAFSGAKIEGAYTSGLAAGEYLAQALSD